MAAKRPKQLYAAAGDGRVHDVSGYLDRGVPPDAYTDEVRARVHCSAEEELRRKKE